MSSYFYAASAVTGDVVCYRLEAAAGTLARAATAPAGGDLSAIAIDAPRLRLYAADRTLPGIVTFALSPADGGLSRLAVTATASQLVYLSLSADRRRLYGVSYRDGIVCEHPVSADGVAGSAAHSPLLLGADAHCHAVVEGPGGQLWVSALGHDLIYRVGHDAGTGELASVLPPVPVAAASGPRHLCVSTRWSQVYVIGERDARVTACSLADGGIRELPEFREWSTIPGDIRLAPGIVRVPDRVQPSHDPVTGLPYTWAADLMLSPDERLLFSSERSSSTVSVTSALTGELLATTRAERQPRGIAVDPSGQFLLVTGELSRTVSLYRVQDDGRKLSLAHQAPAPPGLLWARAAELTP